MERALVAIASAVIAAAVITGAIFLSALALVQFVTPHLLPLAEHLPMFFGVLAILFAVMAIFYRSRHDMTRSLTAILSALNMAFLFGVNSLLPFLRPLVVNHHLAPAAVAMIFAGPFAIGVVNLVILRRIVMLQRTRQ